MIGYKVTLDELKRNENLGYGFKYVFWNMGDYCLIVMWDNDMGKYVPTHIQVTLAEKTAQSLCLMLNLFDMDESYNHKLDI